MPLPAAACAACGRDEDSPDLRREFEEAQAHGIQVAQELHGIQAHGIAD